MQREFRSGLAALGKADTRPTLKPAESAGTMVDFVEALNGDKGGHFLNYKGEEISW
jgi:hypothetical protein